MRPSRFDDPGLTEARATPRPHIPRHSDEAGSIVQLLALQRSAGNRAVVERLSQRPPTRDAVLTTLAAVQRCGPTPCNCSADERAEYAQAHPPHAEIETSGAVL